jgi:hypothetical protein
MKAPGLVNAQWFLHRLVMYTERTRDGSLLLSCCVYWKKSEECLVVSNRGGTKEGLL